MATAEANTTERRNGALYGAGAYLLWGVFPLYFPLLKPAGAVEILAQRIVWSLVAVVAVLAISRSFGSFRAVLRERRKLLLLGVAAVLIAVNWGTFIYAVNSDHVIESSLGYFITPLVSAAFGVLIFREQLRSRQAIALGIGALAVVVLAVDYGRLPWISLVLAASFGSYGLVKKIVNVGAAESLAAETLILLAPAIACVIVLQASGSGTFTHEAPGHPLLLMASGIVTALPLLLFSASVTRVPLTVLAMLQYLAPVLQFLVGLVVVGEAMPPSRWIGFGLVWLALAVLTGDLLHATRRTRLAAIQEPA
jgi:chloramphenicol-sensitive protein RarD